MMLQEAFSTVLKKHYVQVAGGCLFEDGLLLPWLTVKAMEKDKADELYQKELQKAAVLYNYNQTKFTGILTVQERKAPAKPAESLKSAEKPDVKNPDEEVLQEKALPVLIVVLILIGIITVGLSIYYTRTALMAYLPVVLASSLAFSMVVFNSAAFNLIVIYRKRRQWVTAGIFLLLFIVSTGFSMTNTMQVNFNRYTESTRKSMEQHKDVNRTRIQLKAIDEELATLDAKIKAKDERIAYYEQQEWGTNQLQKDKEVLLNDKSKKQAQKTALKEAEPDAVLTEDTKDRTFYDAVSDLLHNRLTAETIQFLLSTLPALFIDIIAPFSLATAVQLLGVKKKEEKYGSNRKAD